MEPLPQETTRELLKPIVPGRLGHPQDPLDPGSELRLPPIVARGRLGGCGLAGSRRLQQCAGGSLVVSGIIALRESVEPPRGAGVLVVVNEGS